MIRFPEREDIRLERSPLKEVICQVRFPIILRVASEQPSEFQDRIRELFPEMEIEQGLLLKVEPLGSSAPDVRPQAKIYRFKSPDGKTLASLAPDFYALSTNAYTHWADFLALFGRVSDAVCEVYRIPYGMRVGLRYINELTFDNTGVDTVEDLWDIPREELTLPMRSECWDTPLESLTQLLLAGEEQERLALRTGFKAGEKPTFLLDLDYFVEGRIPIEALIDLCDRFHEVIYNAFRWCIREDKLEAFLPVAISKG